MGDDRLEPLRQRFRKRCGSDVSVLEVWAAGTGDSAEVERIVHNLAGAAGILGFAEIQAEAGHLDDAFAVGAVAPDMTALIALLHRTTG